MNNFLEIKRHKNKPEQRFMCTLLHREPDYAVLRYTSETPGLIADIRIPPHSTTIAHYRVDRNYVAWRMFDCTGHLLGTLFHVCSNVVIGHESLSYVDLLLDLWISPDGALRVLDEDELRQATSNGLLSDAELSIIDNAHWQITTHNKSIIDELSAFEAAHRPVAVPGTHSA